MCDQLLSDVRLPSGWTKNVKSAILHVLSLAQFALTYTRGWATDALSPHARQGDLLPGPNKHAKVTDQAAYELPTGKANRRVLVRRMPKEPKWLVTAWASDGVEGPATVEIPDLGSVTLQARAIGSVYTATPQDGKPVLQQVDVASVPTTRGAD